jgi:3-oxoacyl-[acyl-carrier protein] reductase
MKPGQMNAGAVLVTGSSRGIGRATALRLARDGYDVWLHHSGHSDAAAIDAVADEARSLGRAVDILVFDIANRDACDQALRAQLEARGAPYGVVLNAGIARDDIFPALTGENWDHVLRTNLDGFYNVLHPLVMPMIRRRRPGRIVTWHRSLHRSAIVVRSITAHRRRALLALRDLWPLSLQVATSRSTALRPD